MSDDTVTTKASDQFSPSVVQDGATGNSNPVDSSECSRAVTSAVRGARWGGLDVRTDEQLRSYVNWRRSSAYVAQREINSVTPRPEVGAAVARAQTALTIFYRVVPDRIANEEIGDALEVIHAMAKDERSTWAIYLKVTRTIFWVCVHTAMEKFVGVVKLAMGQGHDRR